MSDNSDPRLEFKRLEYSNLPALIAHWDAHFWHKSQWFFGVESLILAAVGIAFKDTFLDGFAPKRPGFFFLVGSCVFNFWICYVWFRTNRANREFLTPLLHRAREIETEFLKNEMGTFSAQQNSLTGWKHAQHSSHQWENHLPSGFALAWAVGLLVAALHGDHLDWALGTLMLVFLVVLLFECFHPRRTSTPPSITSGSNNTSM